MKIPVRSRLNVLRLLFKVAGAGWASVCSLFVSAETIVDYYCWLVWCERKIMFWFIIHDRLRPSEQALVGLLWKVTFHMLQNQILTLGFGSSWCSPLVNWSLALLYGHCWPDNHTAVLLCSCSLLLTCLFVVRSWMLAWKLAALANNKGRVKLVMVVTCCVVVARKAVMTSDESYLLTEHRSR